MENTSRGKDVKAFEDKSLRKYCSKNQPCFDFHIFILSFQYCFFSKTIPVVFCMHFVLLSLVKVDRSVATKPSPQNKTMKKIKLIGWIKPSPELTFCNDIL